ncbi:MAG: D-alanyl-D-alanine carboxypeptidase [Ferruginibacter sp.]|nr:D-alanyl-D-alanine carboxypeptidase [Ferruginibacter sp.]
MEKSVYCLRFTVSSNKNHTIIILFIAYCLLAVSCSVTKQISKQASSTLLKDSAINTGHIGISIYEPATQKYWYNHNATQYFIPASNTKLFTLYAGMKYLGDSLVGGYYRSFSDTAISFIATGDPTFLHPDFKNQPLLDFLKREKKTIYVSGSYNDEALGYGWAWDDYNDDYMAERNIFPSYGNLISVHADGYKEINKNFVAPNWKIKPVFFEPNIPNIFLLDAKVRYSKLDSSDLVKLTKKFDVIRDRMDNRLSLIPSSFPFTKNEIPFYTNKKITTIEILNKDFNLDMIDWGTNAFNPTITQNTGFHTIKSQPSDSLFKIMMHRSDNFFAEQTLIMASKRGWNNLADKNETLVLIDTVLKLHLPKIAQRPKWVDGSGLSRYNLFTPQSFVQILNQLQVEFGLERLKVILPTGGEGTLSSYYKKYAGHIFAKTGTLSNNCALSGYLITKKGKLLIFSVLNNNYITGATPIRKAVEKFLGEVMEKY